MSRRPAAIRCSVAAAMFGLAAAALVLAGCSASSTRFATPGESVDHEEENELRFATRIREEERREDDRPVSAEETGRRLSKRSATSTRYENTTPAGLNRDRLLLDVVDYLGVPYVYGGNTKKGIDCSGFTAQVYQSAVQKKLPRSAREQYAFGTPVNRTRLQFGDLVFFNTTGRVPSHVGIYIEDELFAHASVTRGVTFSSLESTYYRKRFVGARRVVGAPAE
ncbi:MAG: spr product [Bacteroidetes bacterium]|nr:spr product [Bacteroidota bacterium]